MRSPSDAQALLLGCVESHGLEGDEVLAGIQDGGPQLSLYVERTGAQVDRRCTPMSVGLGHLEDTDILAVPATLARVRMATFRACERNGWLDITRSREIVTKCLGVCWKGYGDAHWHVALACVDLTDGGTIALGLWRQRKMSAPPAAAPEMNGREREVAELAQRALELGYALCARKPARQEARRMKRAGWFDRNGCWVANNASGLVPSSMAVVELRPELADGGPRP